jgi:drug/metabolite transporter (DMT)-like permease
VNPGILFAILATLSWAIGIFPFTEAARRLGTNTLNHFRLVLASLLIGILALLTGNNFLGIFSEEYKNAWLWLGLSGIIGLTIGDYFAFEMYRILGARTGSVLTTFAPAAALILGGILINEKISFTGIIGIIITIIGVNFISFGKSERKKIPDHGHGSILYGIITGILAALCQGAGLVLAKKGFISMTSENTLSPVHATFMRLICATISLFIFTMFRGNYREVILPLKLNSQKGIRYAVAGTLFGPVIGVCFSLFTVSYIDPSIAQTFFSLVPALAFIFSAALLREKMSMKSIAGLIVAIAGVMILIWREKLI